MRNFAKLAVALFVIATVLGCASSKSSKTEETAAAPAELPSGTIHFEEWQLMAILGGDWGHGTLGYDGKTYKIKVTGLGAGGWGGQKISATGEVYHLNDIADFPGKYVEFRGGLTVAKGFGGLYVRNGKGVVIKLKTHAEGVALSLGIEGLSIEMEDEK